MFKNWYYLHCQRPIKDETIKKIFLPGDPPVKVERGFENSVMLATDMSLSSLRNAIEIFSEEIESLEPYILFKVKQGSAIVTSFQQPSTQTSPEDPSNDPPVQGSK